MRKIIFGIRKSRLAHAQLDEFVAYIVSKGLEMEYEIKTVTTKGDLDRETPVEELGQGIFIKELEKELLLKNIDCALHSLKDVPVETAQGTLLSCFPMRGDERDCLVCRDAVSPSRLKDIRVASGSPRRKAFIKELAPAIDDLPLRGNVDTRLRKLDQGEFDAIVLAACGLKRIGKETRISEYFDSDKFVPAAGQGGLSAQTRCGDTELNFALKDISCQDTQKAVQSERRVLRELSIGCRMPFGVFARFEKGEFIITAKMYIEGKDSYIYCRQKGPQAEFEKVTAELIGELEKQI